MISICTTIKNRSRVRVDNRELLLFPNCVRSIVASVDRTLPCELVVTDWGSDDWPLHQWLDEAAWPVPVQILRMKGPFSRGHGLNAAAQAARGEALFFIDVDSLLSKAVLARGLEVVHAKKAFFPVLYSFDSPDHQNGWWRHEGYGHCMLDRALFERSGGWPEYKSWGKEDEDCYGRIATMTEVIREEAPGLYHQWHPNDIAWKDRYSATFSFAEEERQQVRRTIAELEQIIPTGTTFILVDETRFGYSGRSGRKALPFTEREGEYWGPPADDAEAIQELHRLRTTGAAFIVFPWIAFWWLGHYTAFNQHLRSSFPCIHESERLIVFDVRQPQTSAGDQEPLPITLKSNQP